MRYARYSERLMLWSNITAALRPLLWAASAMCYGLMLQDALHLQYIYTASTTFDHRVDIVIESSSQEIIYMYI